MFLFLPLLAFSAPNSLRLLGIHFWIPKVGPKNKSANFDQHPSISTSQPRWLRVQTAASTARWIPSVWLLQNGAGLLMRTECRRWIRKIPKGQSPRERRRNLGTSDRWSPYFRTAPLSWSWDFTGKPLKVSLLSRVYRAKFGFSGTFSGAGTSIDGTLLGHGYHTSKEDL